MTDISHLYDDFTDTADRIEIGQEFAIQADEPSLVAFRSGRPRPERSIRTSPWLSRMAAGVLAGKQWRRIRVVQYPLTEYLRWELASYVEAQACGQQTWMLPWDDWIELGYDGPEPWGFDLGTDHGAVGLLHYTEDGAVRDRELTTAPDALTRYKGLWDRALEKATPLNEWMVLAEGVRA